MTARVSRGKRCSEPGSCRRYFLLYCTVLRYTCADQAASLSGQSQGSGSPPPDLANRRDKSPGQAGAAAGPTRPMFALRGSPHRRRLPQIPGRGRGAGAGRGRGEATHSWERGRRQQFGRPTGGQAVPGSGGYSDTEMLSERNDDYETWAERHRQRLDTLR